MNSRVLHSIFEPNDESIADAFDSLPEDSKYVEYFEMGRLVRRVITLFGETKTSYRRSVRLALTLINDNESLFIKESLHEALNSARELAACALKEFHAILERFEGVPASEGYRPTSLRYLELKQSFCNGEDRIYDCFRGLHTALSEYSAFYLVKLFGEPASYNRFLDQVPVSVMLPKGKDGAINYVQVAQNVINAADLALGRW